jgi:hypothetical protein
LSIYVLADSEPLKTGALEPSFSSAHTLIEALTESSTYNKAVDAARKQMQPLISELTIENTKTRIAETVRSCLEKDGIHVDGFSVQPYDGSAHTATLLEEQESSGARGDALLVIVPQLALSKDMRVLTLTAQSHVYPSASSIPGAEDIFSISSTPLASDDPISQWSASGGNVFFDQVDTESTALCGQVTGMFK